MRVLMLGWEFPPYKSGGLGTACLGLTKGLARQGVDVTFVLPHSGEGIEVDHVRILPVSSWSARLHGVRSPLSPYLTSAEYRRAASGGRTDVYGADLHSEVWRYAQVVERLAREEPHDVIHAHDWMAFPAAAAARGASGRPVVAHLHSTEEDRTRGWPDERIRALEQDGLLGADLVIANSRYTKDNAVRLYGLPPERIRVIHFGIDPETTAAPSREPRPVPHEKVVLFLGRLTVQKGTDYFVEAAAHVLRLVSDVRFVVVGSGDTMPAMMERAAELGIADRFTFAGFLEGEQVHRAFRMADVYVMPSVSEPYGLAALEALQNGVPVLVSKQSGVSEVVQAALKVDFWDVEDMASKIVSVLVYPELEAELREAGPEEARRMDLDRPARQTLDVYRELVTAGEATR